MVLFIALNLNCLFYLKPNLQIILKCNLILNFSLQYDYMFVDNITLSVFDSTGWYLVNYSQADDFRFGKGIVFSFHSFIHSVSNECNLNTNL